MNNKDLPAPSPPEGIFATSELSPRIITMSKFR